MNYRILYLFQLLYNSIGQPVIIDTQHEQSYQRYHIKLQAIARVVSDHVKDVGFLVDWVKEHLPKNSHF